MVDAMDGRLDGFLVEVVFGFHHQRMRLSSDLPTKVVSLDPFRALFLDPPFCSYLLVPFAYKKPRTLMPTSLPLRPRLSLVAAPFIPSDF